MQPIVLSIDTIGKIAEKWPNSSRIPREQFCKKFLYFASYHIPHKTPNTLSLGAVGDKIHDKCLKPTENRQI